jgi:hypothetical protein
LLETWKVRWDVKYAQLIEEFGKGADLVKEAVTGMSREEVRKRPVAGKWSTLEVVCHLADFEIVGADRVKRVIAEDRPTLPDGDENAFAARLAYHEREIADELTVIAGIRAQVTRILQSLSEEDFARVGNHTAAGPLTLLQLVERMAKHVRHHVGFIEEKRKAMGK